MIQRFDSCRRRNFLLENIEFVIYEILLSRWQFSFSNLIRVFAIPLFASLHFSYIPISSLIIQYPLNIYLRALDVKTYWTEICRRPRGLTNLWPRGVRTNWEFDECGVRVCSLISEILREQSISSQLASSWNMVSSRLGKFPTVRRVRIIERMQRYWSEAPIISAWWLEKFEKILVNSSYGWKKFLRKNGAS